MKRIALLFLAVIFGKSVSAQQEGIFTVVGSGMFSTHTGDYQCVGINPANLGIIPERNKIHMGFLEGDAYAFSDALRQREVRQAFLNMAGFGTQRLTQEQKQQAAIAFANNGLATNLSGIWLGAAVQLPRLGGIGFNVREKLNANMRLNPLFADIMFNGFDADQYFQKFYDPQTNDSVGVAPNPMPVSEITDGSTMQMTWTREYNVAYGRKVTTMGSTEIFGGVGVKYIQGLGVVDLRSENGEFTAYSSLSPMFRVDYGLRSARIDTVGSIFDGVGSGFGLDFGVTVIVDKKATIAAAVDNIGSINWKTNVLMVSDEQFDSIRSSGINSYNVFSEADKMVGASGILKWKDAGTQNQTLPTGARFGFKYTILKNLNVGFDGYVPFNNLPGNPISPQYSVGGEIVIKGAVKLSGAFTLANGYQVYIPIGVVATSNEGRYELGIATRDIISVFASRNPNLSAAFGFLRFGLM